MNRHSINNTHEHSSVIFVGISESREINPQTESDQGVECRWVTKEELEILKETDSRLRPENHRYAKAALELVS